jgi:cytochrome P450
MFPFFGDGIFTQDGASWKHSRELLRPQFAQGQYKDFEIFRDAVDDLINALPSEGVVDLQPLFFRLTLDTTTAFLFGESVKSLRASDSTSETTFATAFNIAQDFIAKRMRLTNVYWLIGGKQFTKACEDVHRFADQIIDQNLHNQKKHNRYVFLNSIAKEIGDRTALRSQIINILVAGRDTTACALSWTLYVFSGPF